MNGPILEKQPKKFEVQVGSMLATKINALFSMVQGISGKTGKHGTRSEDLRLKNEPDDPHDTNRLQTSFQRLSTTLKTLLHRKHHCSVSL